MKPNVYVYYHAPCHDGFLAQLLIKRILKTTANVTTCPLKHGGPAPDLSQIQPGSSVLFVDIAPKPALLAELEACENVATINVWDHHIDYRSTYDGAGNWKAQILPNFFDITLEHVRSSQKTTLWFCNEISGSKLAPIAAWFWISQSNWDDEEQAIVGAKAAEMYTHPIVIHASDYDTWTKEYPNTDAVFAYYRNFTYDDEAPWHQLLDRITSFYNSGYRDVVTKGEHMLEALKSLAYKLASGDTPRPLSITVASGTYSGVICNAYSLLVNDLGDIFKDEFGYDFVIAYSITPSKIAISVRSKPGIPANEIAQKWGGGGHAESAGAGIVGTTAMVHWLKEFAFDPNS